MSIRAIRTIWRVAVVAAFSFRAVESRKSRHLACILALVLAALAFPSITARADDPFAVLEQEVATTPETTLLTVNTPVGDNVSVDLGAGVVVTFARVTTAGNTTLATSTVWPGGMPGSAPLPSVALLPTRYGIETGAEYDGDLGLDVTITYDNTGLSDDELDTISL